MLCKKVKSKNVLTAYHLSRKQQSGATLLVALIILLVMSIIGIASMKGSTLQERMAGNARQKAVATNAAQLAMREAELWLIANIANPPAIPNLSAFDGSAALFSASARTGASAQPVDFDVTDEAAWASEGVQSTAMSSALVSTQPKYIIEYLGRDKGPAASVSSGDREEIFNVQNQAYVFRITAIGWGKDANIVTVLESTYITGIN